MFTPVFVVTFLAGLTTGAHITETDVVFQNVDGHFNERLCLDLLMVDCFHHTVIGDEKICASNGVTYPNHCAFVHARCKYWYGPNNIYIAKHGACASTSMAPAGATTAPIVPAATTMAPAGTTMAPAGTTNAPAATKTTTMGTTTTTQPPPTTKSVGNIIKDVFCRNMDSISCSSTFNIICGSDGQLYPNQCELSKANCRDPSVVIVDSSKCSLPTSLP